jgi:flagellum-specific peptidoglycan hydrolase FlgJ
MSSWQGFIDTLSETTIEFEQLKVAQLSQAILESGRGKSGPSSQITSILTV